jgi:arylsulfatase
MTIDLLPTLAGLCGASLPEKTIDGKDLWPLLSGQTLESPQPAYFFYYHVNELQAVRQGDWKLYFPHRYRSMKGQEPGHGGLPGNYTYFELGSPELYNLKEDPEEQYDVAQRHPEVVATLSALADDMRTRLGDALTGVQGLENRPPGKVPEAGKPE